MASIANATNTAANAVDNSPQTIEGDGTLIANAPETGTNTVLADADHTNGDATATATSNESAAVVDSDLTGNGNASVVVREHLSITADAETTTGDASADADNDSNEDQTGGLINSNQSVGGDYAQSVDVDNSTSAAATTTTGAADAEATEDSSFGILDSNIDVEGNYNSTVENDNSISSSASTTDGSADADSMSEERTGIRFGVGDALTVKSDANLTVTVGTEDDPTPWEHPRMWWVMVGPTLLLVQPATTALPVMEELLRKSEGTPRLTLKWTTSMDLQLHPQLGMQVLSPTLQATLMRALVLVKPLVLMQD